MLQSTSPCNQPLSTPIFLPLSMSWIPGFSYHSPDEVCPQKLVFTRALAWSHLTQRKYTFITIARGGSRNFRKGGGAGGRKPNSRKGGGAEFDFSVQLSVIFLQISYKYSTKRGAVARPAPLLKLQTSRRLLQVRSKPQLRACYTNKPCQICQSDGLEEIMHSRIVDKIDWLSSKGVNEAALFYVEQTVTVHIVLFKV